MRDSCCMPGCEAERAIMKDREARVYESSFCLEHQDPDGPDPGEPWAQGRPAAGMAECSEHDLDEHLDDCFLGLGGDCDCAAGLRTDVDDLL